MIRKGLHRWRQAGNEGLLAGNRSPQRCLHESPPYVIEQDKPEGERGYYTNPELYGAPKEQGIRWPRQLATKKP
jgi:hypothetical protein